MKRWMMATALVGVMTGTGALSLGQQPPAKEQPVERQQQQQEQLQQSQRQKAQAEYRRALDAERQMLDAHKIAADPAHQAFFRAFAPHTGKMEKVPYCGVATVEIPPALTEQLKLTPGMGLLVDFVEPSSPAEAAGIKQYDILLKFNDQLLVNAEQLRALVRMKMSSDDVKFALIRRGEASSANVELGEKEMEVVAEANTAQAPQAMKPYGFGHNGQLVVDGIPVMPGGGGGGGGYGGGGGMMGGAMGGGGGGVMAFTNATGRNQMVLKDPEGTFNLELRGGKAVTLVAKDRAGNEIFNGPVETDEQRNALPANLIDKLKKAEQGGPMRTLRLTGVNGTAPRSRVLSSTDKDTLMIARFDNGKATHVFAFSTTDGKTLFDGPTTDDAQRKAMPEEVAKQLETLEKSQDAGVEFGVVGRGG
jgi:membrane-associated protease RseP (regulator of RpoE activity)